jgi:hypothetical protein
MSYEAGSVFLPVSLTMASFCFTVRQLVPPFFASQIRGAETEFKRHEIQCEVKRVSDFLQIVTIWFLVSTLISGLQVGAKSYAGVLQLPPCNNVSWYPLYISSLTFLELAAPAAFLSGVVYVLYFLLRYRKGVAIIID